VNASSNTQSFLGRHEFLIRRLHSLTGLIPIGAFMTVHLLVNSSILDSPGTFQRNVYQIHSLGRALPLVEWSFIFLPILFHGLFGLLIILGGLANTGHYPYVNNVRYVWQRVTGIIAFVFILLHVFHMHGWFHFEAWVNHIVDPLGGAQFRPFNAASTLGVAMHGFVIPLLYAIGVFSCVYHFANGIWTMGITWGLWSSPGGQRRANWIAVIVGAALAAVGAGALIGAVTVDTSVARDAEDAMYGAKVRAHLIEPTPEKRADNARSISVAREEAARPTRKKKRGGSGKKNKKRNPKKLQDEK